jgi:hypothetical protein
MDASFHGGSNDTIATSSDLSAGAIAVFSRRRPFWPALASSHYTLTFTFGGKGGGRHLTAAALSSRSDVIRIVFSLLMSPSLVC